MIVFVFSVGEKKVFLIKKKQRGLKKTGGNPPARHLRKMKRHL